jgi:hypothetical protein
MERLTTTTRNAPHRYADLAVALADQLRADQNPDACARWLCGELPDPLDRWAFTFFLARLSVTPGESSASVLKRLWRPDGRRAA